VSIIGTVKWITTRRRGRVSLSGTEVECIHKFWWGTWKYQKLGRSRLEQEDNTVMNLKEIGWLVEKWTYVAQNMDIMTSCYNRLPLH